MNILYFFKYKMFDQLPQLVILKIFNFLNHYEIQLLTYVNKNLYNFVKNNYSIEVYENIPIIKKYLKDKSMNVFYSDKFYTPHKKIIGKINKKSLSLTHYKNNERGNVLIIDKNEEGDVIDLKYQFYEIIIVLLDFAHIKNINCKFLFLALEGHHDLDPESIILENVKPLQGLILENSFTIIGKIYTKELYVEDMDEFIFLDKDDDVIEEMAKKICGCEIFHTTIDYSYNGDKISQLLMPNLHEYTTYVFNKTTIGDLYEISGFHKRLLRKKGDALARYRRRESPLYISQNIYKFEFYRKFFKNYEVIDFICVNGIYLNLKKGDFNYIVLNSNTELIRSYGPCVYSTNSYTVIHKGEVIMIDSHYIKNGYNDIVDHEIELINYIIQKF